MKQTYTFYFLLVLAIIFSSNASAQKNWTIVSSTNNNADPIYFDVTHSSASNWHLCGENATVLLSDNYGKTWIDAKAGITSKTEQFNTIEFSSSNVGFLGGVTTSLQIGNYGVLYYTTDGGQSWTKYSTGSSLPRVNAIHFPSLYRGYAVAGNKVLRTTSAGSSWSYNYTYGSIDLYDIHFPDSLIGFACGELGSIIRTEDGGESWQTVYWGSNDNDFYSVHFLNKNVGFVCGVNGSILRTDNGGNDWVEYNTGVSTDFTSISFYNNSEGIIVGEHGDILYTNNGGNNFSYMQSPTTNHLLGVSMFSQNQAVAVGYRQSILKYGTLGVGNKKIEPLSETTLRLYPNPATKEVNIQLAQNENDVEVSIFDMTGKSLYSKTHNFQLKSITIPTDELKKGVYTVQVKTKSNTFNQRFIKQ